VTVLPALTATLLAWKKLSFTLTAPAVGGAAAVAEKVIVGRLVIAGVAVTDCGVVDPMLSVALATPDALVELCAGLTPPPPVAGAQLTTTPGTAQFLASFARTLNAAGSGLLKYQD
jgi:hypothetical protein